MCLPKIAKQTNKKNESFAIIFGILVLKFEMIFLKFKSFIKAEHIKCLI
jgi:hypothetical protein